MSADDDFAFWTIELINSAIPADKFLCTAWRQQDTYQPTGPIGSSHGPTGSAREIYTDELTATPYQSVGRLIVYGEYRDVQGHVMKQSRSATAFYIGNSTLLTVAHAFSLTTSVEGGGVNTFKETGGGIFIPAMIPGEKLADVCKNYGMFLFRPGGAGHFLHPKYDPQQRNPQYDICKVTICKGKKGDQLIASIDHEDVGLQPFVVLKNENYTPQTTWRVLGYPAFQGWHYLAMMVEVSGKYRHDNKEELQINTGAEVLPGMSGGPWILAEQQASMVVNGIQAGNPPSIQGICIAVSPYFSSDLFHELELHVDNSNLMEVN